MSSIQNSSDLSFIFHSLRERLSRYLPESSERSQVILQSTALMQISYATIKNIPYAFLSKEMGTNDLAHMLSSRVNYIEATLLTVMSVIHNLFFATFYTGLAISTLGLFSSINFGCRMHWHHVTYGMACTGIGLLGVATPYYGAGLNVMLVYATLNMMKKCYGHDVHLFERPLLHEIQEIFKNYGSIIYNYTREKVRNDVTYQNIYRPSLEHIENRIFEAKRMDDLVTLALDISNQWPKVGLSDSNYKDMNSKKRPSAAVHKHYE